MRIIVNSKPNFDFDFDDRHEDSTLCKNYTCNCVFEVDKSDEYYLVNIFDCISAFVNALKLEGYESKQIINALHKYSIDYSYWIEEELFEEDTKKGKEDEEI